MYDKIKDLLKSWFHNCYMQNPNLILSSSKICDSCNCQIIPPNGFLIGGSFLECDGCTSKLLDEANWDVAIDNIEVYFGPNVPQHIIDLAYSIGKEKGVEKTELAEKLAENKLFMLSQAMFEVEKETIKWQIVKWQVLINDKVYGPYTVNQIKKGIQQKKITRKARIRQQGSNEWLKASRFTDLFLNSPTKRLPKSEKINYTTVIDTEQELKEQPKSKVNSGTIESQAINSDDNTDIWYYTPNDNISVKNISGPLTSEQLLKLTLVGEITVSFR